MFERRHYRRDERRAFEKAIARDSVREMLALEAARKAQEDRDLSIRLALQRAHEAAARDPFNRRSAS